MCAARLRSCKPETRMSGSRSCSSRATIVSSRGSIRPRYVRATSKLSHWPGKPGSRTRSGRWSRSDSRISSGFENRLHPARLLLDVVPLRRGARRGVGARQLSGLPQGRRDRVLVEGVDEDSGLRRHELRRAADLRPDDRAAAGHPFEQGLAEVLAQARLTDDVGFGYQFGDSLVWNGTKQANFVASFELGT